MPAATKNAAAEGSKDAMLQSLPATIPPHFQQAQHSLANHRKNIVSLYRIHYASSQISEQTTKGDIRLLGEKKFNSTFLGCLDRILDLKRGVSNADRVIKFAAAYCAYAQETFRAAARKELQESGEEMEEDEEEEDTPATRFIAVLIRHLLGGFNAKDKNVRLRCCQAVALLIDGLESIDDALYEKLKTAMLTRASDKESSVRVQAIIALAKLQGGEEEEEEVEGMSITITETLKQLLRHDPSAEARRAALFNVPQTQKTLPDILERQYDVDTMNRRCLYLGILTNAVLNAPHCHFKISKDQWSSIIKIGLGDREPSVVKATKKLILSWVNVDEGKDEVAKFLNRFGVVTNPESASMALEAAFEVRPALLDTLSFDNDFWDDLTPEKAFAIRVFAKHCKTLGTIGERRIEDTMPLVTALAYRTQAAWGKFVEEMEKILEAQEDNEEALRACESIVQSLLHVSMNLDYGDEIGRRKMFGLVRELVSSPMLPETLINECLDVLRKLSAGQKDFIRIIVEIAQEIEDVVEVQEADASNESDDEAMIEGQLLGQQVKEISMSNEEKEQQISIDARRLMIVRGMLERIIGAGGVQENPVMQGLIPQLIVPAVESKNSILRGQALICLGLFCLLDAQLAQSTFNLFLQQVEEEDQTIRVAAIKVVFDNLTSYGIKFLCKAQMETVGSDVEAIESIRTQLVNYLLGLLEDDNEEVQAIAAEGMSKLLMSGTVEDDDALRSLILIYMSPETSANQQLRQCLSYVLPAYCYSSSICQRRLQRILLPTLEVLTEVYYERDDDQEDMVTPLYVGMQLLDWSDPKKVQFGNKDMTVHIDLALELIEALYIKEEKEDRKVLCQLLTKLNLPEEKELKLSFVNSSPDLGSEDASTTTNTDEDFLPLALLFALMGTLKKVQSLDKWDASSRNHFNKFQINCKVKYVNSWERVKMLEPLQAMELQGLRTYLTETCGLEVENVINIGDDDTTIASKQRQQQRQQQKKPISSSSTGKRSGTASRGTSASTSRKASVGSVVVGKDNEKDGETARAARRSYVPIVIDSESEEDDRATSNPTIKIEEEDGNDSFDVL